MAVNRLELYLYVPSQLAQEYHGVIFTFTNHLSSLQLLKLPKYVIKLSLKQCVVSLFVLKMCVIKDKLLNTKMTLNTNIVLYN